MSSERRRSAPRVEARAVARVPHHEERSRRPLGVGRGLEQELERADHDDVPVVGQQPPWDTGDPDGATAENCVRFKNSFDFEDKPCGDPDSYVCECDRFAPN